MYEVTMSSFKVKNDLDGRQATGPRQLTSLFKDTKGRIIVIGVDTESYVVSGYYNHHIDNGVLIGMDKSDIINIINDLKSKHGATAAMIIIRTDDWLEREQSLLEDHPGLLHSLLDEINQVATRGRSLMCEDYFCCPSNGWEIV